MAKTNRKVFQLMLPERLKNEMVLAAYLDDDKVLNQFIVDAIRVRVNRFLDEHRHEIPVGHPLYRPEGAPVPRDKEEAIQNALARIEAANTVPTPNSTPHPLGRHLPGGPRYAPEPKR